MTAEPHTLSIRPRRNQLNVDGICSCTKWRLANQPRAVVREQHAQHVQRQLRPDGDERRER